MGLPLPFHDRLKAELDSHQDLEGILSDILHGFDEGPVPGAMAGKSQRDNLAKLFARYVGGDNLLDILLQLFDDFEAHPRVQWWIHELFTN